MTICHVPSDDPSNAHEIEVAVTALAAHLGHGDTLGECPTDAPGDADGDGVDDAVDNCPEDDNPGQEDADADAVGDGCDNCPADDNPADSHKSTMFGIVLLLSSFTELCITDTFSGSTDFIIALYHYL